MPTSDLHPADLLRPRRRIVGMSAVLLPYDDRHEIDWPAFRAHILRTTGAGLTPAVNMDTGYVNLLDPAARLKVLAETKAVLAGQSFVAGAFVADSAGATLSLDRYRREIARVQEFGGLPIIFQSFGLSELPNNQLIGGYRTITRDCDRFLAFELGSMFAPFGKVYDLDAYAELISVPSCIGAKHSSLNRQTEWQRLQVRDELRPDFLVLTGNDLAIDMVMYGSDYLLGLATYAPDLFAQRDQLWFQGDPAFYELNDLLQYLGAFVFRPPVPAYKHSAAMFLKLRGWIASDQPHPACRRRPDSDREVLQDILNRFQPWIERMS